MNLKAEVPERAAIRLLKGALESGVVLPVAATGRSMVPVIFSGEEVLIQHCRADDLLVGDVVLLDFGTRMVLHRIYHVEDGSILTKGDGCLTGDHPVVSEAVIGRVVGLTGSRSRQLIWRLADGFFRGVSVLVFEPHRKKLGWVYRTMFQPIKTGQKSPAEYNAD